jgi:hypothetical protein
MKKNILFPILLVCNLSAFDKAEQQSFDNLLNEVTQLKNEIATLKKNQKENTQAIEESVDFTENVEANLFKDKINFGINFKTNLENFSKKYADGDNVDSNNIWSNKLMINMKADITSNMNFYGRLSMYKYWGSNYIHPYTYYDNMQGRVPASSALYVERAYINWFLFKDSMLPIAFTIGRQPSSDGPSNQFKNNSTRKGTYSALLYDGAADGLVCTANISKIISLPQSFLRLGYSKGYGYSETSQNVGNPFVGASNTDIEDTNIFGLFFDTAIPNIKNSLIQLSYSKMINIVANPLDSNSDTNIDIGSVDLYGAMFELTNIKNTNLDLFAHFGYSIAHPNGNGYLNYGGLLSQTGDTSDKSGYATWLGLRYGLGEDQSYKVGFEYNYGSENWLNLTQGSFDIYNKLSTRGNAYEAYLMYVINRYANIRVGYINIDYNYTGSGWFVGESQKISSSMVNAENTLDKLDSIYLKMNVNF